MFNLLWFLAWHLGAAAISVRDIEPIFRPLFLFFLFWVEGLPRVIGVFHPKECYNKLMTFAQGNNLLLYWRACALVDGAFALLAASLFAICAALFQMPNVRGVQTELFFLLFFSETAALLFSRVFATFKSMANTRLSMVMCCALWKGPLVICFLILILVVSVVWLEIFGLLLVLPYPAVTRAFGFYFVVYHRRGEASSEGQEYAFFQM